MRKVKTLKKNYEFKNVFNKGKYLVNRQVIVYLKSNNFGYNRIGIAISTKICNAVGRNHLKRLIREAYYNFKDLLDENEKHYDIVFTWNKKTNIENASYVCILNDLNRAFTKFDILNK